ncbi:MAG: hypothetical protein P1U82_08525 [Verrucomicrobiales bacterium]|nr:hypothetical protein [Verrucomicrobiales bacterium]
MSEITFPGKASDFLKIGVAAAGHGDLDGTTTSALPDAPCCGGLASRQACHGQVPGKAQGGHQRL